ncbi:hypothetical protein DPMN_075455 [Dreissena polymorpha]|uniref:Uncharacterized protein n=1 Tax=Dreissena polymorpha TaxID=45954 RepID=A0A9D3YI51_DREPO|nr:hypothetical protein DPMN_075455 [Dreissena polymorpha]
MMADVMSIILFTFKALTKEIYVKNTIHVRKVEYTLLCMFNTDPICSQKKNLANALLPTRTRSPYVSLSVKVTIPAQETRSAVETDVVFHALIQLVGT